MVPAVNAFTTDWSGSIEHWPDMLADYVGRPKLRFLEIGCFEGRTSLWLLRNVLTAFDCVLEVVDPFLMDGQLARFQQNLMPYLEAGKVVDRHGWSSEVLRRLPRAYLDFVYVDGDHTPPRVLEDAVLTWPLLKAGGMVCFDDYWWPEKNHYEKPTLAVDAFVDCYWQEIQDARRVGADQFLVVKR